MENFLIFKVKRIILLPIIWLVYFGALFYLYFDALNIAWVNDLYLSDVSKTKEFMWRIVWGLFSIATVLISTISILCSLNAIHENTIKNLSVHSYLIYGLAIISVVIIVSLFNFLGLKLDLGGGAVSSFVEKAEAESKILVILIVDITMVIAFIAACLIAIASSSMLIRTGAVTLIELKRKYSYFRVSFYVTSVFLGIGIAQVYFLFIWASHAVGHSNATAQMAHALTLSGSIIYTLVFIILFIPVSFVLHGWVRNVAKKEINIDDEVEFSEWKKSKGLFNTPSKNISDMAILLSPVILGVMSNIFN